jgi:hypothetical protein
MKIKCNSRLALHEAEKCVPIKSTATIITVQAIKYMLQSGNHVTVDKMQCFSAAEAQKVCKEYSAIRSITKKKINNEYSD